MLAMKSRHLPSHLQKQCRVLVVTHRFEPLTYRLTVYGCQEFSRNSVCGDRLNELAERTGGGYGYPWACIECSARTPPKLEACSNMNLSYDLLPSLLFQVCLGAG